MFPKSRHFQMKCDNPKFLQKVYLHDSIRSESRSDVFQKHWLSFRSDSLPGCWLRLSLIFDGTNGLPSDLILWAQKMWEPRLSEKKGFIAILQALNRTGTWDAFATPNLYSYCEYAAQTIQVRLKLSENIYSNPPPPESPSVLVFLCYFAVIEQVVYLFVI